jgi:hypothetical protein
MSTDASWQVRALNALIRSFAIWLRDEQACATMTKQPRQRGVPPAERAQVRSRFRCEPPTPRKTAGLSNGRSSGQTLLELAQGGHGEVAMRRAHGCNFIGWPWQCLKRKLAGTQGRAQIPQR